MLSRLLRQVLFNIVHLTVSVLVAVQNVYRHFWIKKSDLSTDSVTKNDIQMILEHVPKMTKRLKHLVLLADTDHQTLSDLARLVIWSLVCGIPYISLHDITGNKIYKQLLRSKKAFIIIFELI